MSDVTSVPAFLENIAGQTVSATAKNYTGYTFEGWYDANGNAVDSSMLTDDGKTITVTTSSENHNTTYYARYYANDTKLIYNANYADSKGDTATSTLNGKVDDKVTVNNGSLFERAGYTFVKWNTKKDGKGTDYIANSEYQLKASDNVLYAIWKANENTKYTVNHYLVNTDGTSVSYTLYQSDILAGTTDEEVNASSLDIAGYKYNKDYNVDGIADVSSGVIKGDGTLVLKLYYVNDTSNTRLVYKANGGIGADVIQVGSVNEEVIVKSGTIFKRDGYAFVGWNTKADGSGVMYHAFGSYKLKENDNVLYAIWVKMIDDYIPPVCGIDN